MHFATPPVTNCTAAGGTTRRGGFYSFVESGSAAATRARAAQRLSMRTTSGRDVQAHSGQPISRHPRPALPTIQGFAVPTIYDLESHVHCQALPTAERRMHCDILTAGQGVENIRRRAVTRCPVGMKPARRQSVSRDYARKLRERGGRAEPLKSPAYPAVRGSRTRALHLR